MNLLNSYVKLLCNNYLINPNKNLIKNFVNKYNQRYMIDKNYELKLKRVYNTINTKTNITKYQRLLKNIKQ